MTQQNDTAELRTTADTWLSRLETATSQPDALSELLEPDSYWRDQIGRAHV